ncbi:MAG: FKBP-type peptidyl-prolyl cis-trans isomerase [Lachnospiraceae bacterium]|nr:FKBP-type peptidyl-prolyl cis-trans isomerase [Lachnospiraceae bacterium]
MVIEAGNYIKLNYTGSVNGVPFDTTDAEAAKKGNIFREGFNYAPSIVKVGAGQVLAGVDEDLLGKEVGTEYKVVIPAAKAFGEHNKDEVKALDKKAFDHKPELFERLVVEGREGVVVNKIGSRYLVDFNHPLAGQEVEYVYTIEEVVTDPVECLAGTIKLLTGREMKVSNAHKDSVYIEVPAMIAMYNQNWFMTQYMIMQDALELFPEVDAVKFVESFPRPKKEGEEEEKKPAAKKTAKKAEGETAEKKPAAKKTTKKAEGETAEKKPAAKKTAKKAEGETAEKKPAAKKTTKKAAEKKE